jgi:hypothetical protein
MKRLDDGKLSEMIPTEKEKFTTIFAAGVGLNSFKFLEPGFHLFTKFFL